jgi:LacI family transcriptional regulator
VVCLDRLPKRWDGDSATVANEEGAFQATRYLIQLGHRRLANITGPLHLTNAQQRVDGFKRALAEAGISLAQTYFQETTFDRVGGHSKALLLLRMLPRPTAIFAGNDMIALGVLHAIRDLGLRCPEEVSVMGFDDLDFDEFTSPSLSSVFQPGYQLGATAAHMLLERMQGHQGPASHKVLQTQLKIRGSVGPPPEKPADVPRRAPRKAAARRATTV